MPDSAASRSEDDGHSIDRPVRGGSGSEEGKERAFQLPDPRAPDPDEHVARDQRRRIVQEAIDARPEKYRRVIEPRHQQEFSYKEIADELDRPLGTAEAHLLRARSTKRLCDQRGAL